MAHYEQGLTNWRRGRGRSMFMSSKTWHIMEGSLTGGEEEGGARS